MHLQYLRNLMVIFIMMNFIMVIIIRKHILLILYQHLLIQYIIRNLTLFISKVIMILEFFIIISLLLN